MKIKLDENLPWRLVAILERAGHDTDTSVQEGLNGRLDQEVWEAAQGNARFFITQDLDFSDIRKFMPGSHAGILLLRLREPGRQAILERLRSVFEHENVGSWERCFVVVTERKVRVRRPKDI